MDLNEQEEEEIYHKEKEVFQKAKKDLESHLGKANYHKMEVHEVAKKFQTNLDTGLTSEKAEELLQKYGTNELEHKEKESLWEKIKEQFDDLLVKILLAAAIVSFVIALTDDKEEGLAAYVEPIVIMLILIANAIIGIAQDNNADKAIEALMNMQALECKVLRNGEWKIMDSKYLVPGDVVEVHLGDRNPADIRLAKLKSVSLQIEEASLTGESKGVNKQTEIVNTDSNILQDRKNILFSSTIITYGSGIGIVVSTGMDTAIGSIQKEVQEAEEDEEDTPLKKKLDQFGEVLSYMIGAICLLVWLMNYSNFSDPIHGGFVRGCIYYFKIAVALAVAAIPEGLPAVITTCLALGTRTMAQNHAIVRTLPSVQTLGCTTVICSDKTGTLTKNEMSATKLYFSGRSVEDFNEFEVEDTSYNPEGTINISENQKKEYKNLLLDIATVSTINNHSDIKYDNENGFTKYGAPTEVALKVISEKIASLYGNFGNYESNPCPFNISLEIETLGFLEFDSRRKMMSTVVSGFNGNHRSLLIKGAPERLLDKCTHIRLGTGKDVELSNKYIDLLKKELNMISAQGLRCIGIAANYTGGVLKDLTEDNTKKLLSDFNRYNEYESGATFLGVIGIKDPLREQVPPSIEKCKEAGIRVIMITGDNKQTAEAIAREAGILTPSQESEGNCFTGTEFEQLNEEDKIAAISGHKGKVFARVEPKHKRELVKLLSKQGEIVAMTGDGVNDAPALKQAAIGIAMGITGTEVAKEAADMILTDDNFATIVTAVEQGRSIYSNMQAFIRYLISSNIGEVASIFMTATIGIPEGFTSVQLLWINLVTDGPPATALGFNPPDKDIMKKPPRDPEESLLSNWVIFRYMVIGMYVGAATVGIFIYWYCYDDFGDGHTLVSLNQLRNWSECPDWKDFSVKPYNGMTFDDPCTYFTLGKVKASTLSLSCLVMLEMLNALNALSENGSLIHMPPWINPWLLLAISGSIAIHILIIYIPFFTEIFGTTYMTGYDWLIVMIFSSPVILIDEILKVFARWKAERELMKRLKQD
jgi:P-type Ca2+ transporter type 2C